MLLSDLLKPKTEVWQPPDLSSINLDTAKALSIDLEGYDPDLKTKGPGSKRSDSYIAGVVVGASWGDGERKSWYLPVRHPDSVNLPQDSVIAFLRDNYLDSRPKMGAHIKYDMEWLRTWGLDIPGDWHDVLVAEPLINEHRRKDQYNLSGVAQIYGVPGKDEGDLYTWLARRYGGEPTRRAQGGRIALAPAGVVAPYAMSDGIVPFDVFDKQRAELTKQDLWGIYRLEIELNKTLVDMRIRGVRVDVDKAEQAAEMLTREIKDLQKQLRTLTGMFINVNALERYKALMARFGILEHFLYEAVDKKTKQRMVKMKTDKERLNTCNHPFARLCAEQRKLEKALEAVNKILSNHVEGRVYAEFAALRDEEGGVGPGRFSSRNPNLQNIPARDPRFGPLIRSIFIPEEGETIEALDYGQIEPRLAMHYSGERGDAVRAMLWQDPSKSPYKAMMKSFPDSVTYKAFKAIYLGLSYGMGNWKLGQQLGTDAEGAKEYRQIFETGAPYLPELLDKIQAKAERFGFIRTVLGRRSRYPNWESKDFDTMMEDGSMSKAEAIRKYGPHQIKRSDTRKAPNNLFQGGSADIIKLAMVEAKRQGVWDVLGAPLLQVHDEIVISRPQTPEGEAAVRKLMEIMRTCVELRVPLFVDREVGRDWGHVLEYATQYDLPQRVPFRVTLKAAELHSVMVPVWVSAVNYRCRG